MEELLELLEDIKEDVDFYKHCRDESHGRCD